MFALEKGAMVPVMVLLLLRAVFNGTAAFFFAEIFQISGELGVLICKPNLLQDFRCPTLIYRDPD